MREALARYRQRMIWGFPAPDVVLAAVLVAISTVSVLTGSPAEGPLWLTLPVAIVTTGALLWRRRSPIVAAALIVVAGLVQTLVSQAPGSLWSLAAYVIVVYSVAAYYGEALAAGVGAAIVAALLIGERIDNGVDYLFILLLFGGVWLLGRASRSWRSRVTAAERSKYEAARLAVAQERVRLARDLHDVVAHSLSVIAVQSDAAEAALLHDPARAREPVRAIRATARESLNEIRLMLDVLRTDETDLPGARSPGISAIGGLMDAARAAGLPVHERIELTDAPLPAAIDLAVYRIVQECLTNVMTHASGASVDVRLVQLSDALSLRISNPLADGHPEATLREGYGLVGMRERVLAVGGEVSAGAADGEYVVSVRVPLRPPPTPTSTPTPTPTGSS
jgi:signal transduction histidine kinase